MLTFRKKNKDNQGQDALSLGDFVALPNEIIFYILCFLGPKELTIVCRLSSIFKKLASDNDLWIQFLDPEAKESVVAMNYSAKQVFIQSKKYHISQSFLFYSSSEKLNQVKLLFQKMEQEEGEQGNSQTPLTDYFKKQLMPKNKNQKFFLFKWYSSEPEYDSAQLNKTMGMLSILNEFFDEFLSKPISPFEKGQGGALVLCQRLQQIAVKYGKKAAILNQQGCLEKVIQFLRKEPHIYEINALASILKHKKVVKSENLSALLDRIFTEISQYRQIGLPDADEIIKRVFPKKAEHISDISLTNSN